MIICNGSPKTGTHLLVKAARLFGGNAMLSSHNHDPKLTVPHIHIIRNPRNALISYLRMNKSELTRSNIITEMPSFIAEYSEYIGLLNLNDVLTVTFEDLLTDESELLRISKFIGLPLIEGHFRKLWGQTATFTGDLSNWRNHWHTKAARKWVEYGGDTLEAALGYSPDTDSPKIRPAK